MTLQRITCYLLLIVAALIFVYSLGIITDLYDTLRVFSEDPEHPLIEGAEVYMEMQEFNKLFTLFGVLLILSALANMVFGAASRRRYYLSNYITIVLNAVGNVAVSVWAIINIYSYRAQYLEVVLHLSRFSHLFTASRRISLPSGLTSAPWCSFPSFSSACFRLQTSYGSICL